MLTIMRNRFWIRRLRHAIAQPRHNFKHSRDSMKNFFLLIFIALQATCFTSKAEETCEICFEKHDHSHLISVLGKPDTGREGLNTAGAALVAFCALVDMAIAAYIYKNPDQENRLSKNFFTRASIALAIANFLMLATDLLIPQFNAPNFYGKEISSDSFSCHNAVTESQKFYLPRFVLSKQQYDQLIEKVQYLDGINNLNKVALDILSSVLLLPNVLVTLILILISMPSLPATAIQGQQTDICTPKVMLAGLSVAAFAAFLSKFALYAQERKTYGDAQDILNGAFQTLNCTTAP